MKVTFQDIAHFGVLSRCAESEIIIFKDNNTMSNLRCDENGEVNFFLFWSVKINKNLFRINDVYIINSSTISTGTELYPLVPSLSLLSRPVLPPLLSPFLPLLR